MKRLCKCGHRKYKHNRYPLDTMYCKGEGEGKVFSNELWLKLCLCDKYDPVDNLTYLEEKYEKK